MKRAFIVSALIFSAAFAAAQELPEGLPGMTDEAQTGIQRPDSKRIMTGLSPALRLSSKQEERIGGAITKKSKEFDKLLKEYDKAAAEEKRWQEKVEALKSKMRDLNNSLPDVIRGYLDDEQEQNFDGMLEARKKRLAETQGKSPDGAAVQQPAKKKKKLVKKKKKKSAEQAAEQGEAPAAGPDGAAPVAGPGEEEPGTTMVDSEKSAEPAAPVKKKKKVKKKVKAAAPAEPPAEEPAAEEPSAPADNGGDAPEEEEGGDAGSYP